MTADTPEHTLPSAQEYDWHVREDVETDWDYGGRPEKRSVEELLDNGLVLVDKPHGPTSNQVSAWVKEILHRDKAGHSGTLDPHVTGVLPVGLNKGTKVMGPLSEADKEYICVLKLAEEKSEETVEFVGDQFTGTVTQTPPEKSAVKRQPRDREIYYLNILDVDGKQVLFKIGCEKGFYVRTFCEQFAEALSTDGEMEALRRTKVGVFSEYDCHILQDLVDAYEYRENGEEHALSNYVLPVEAGVRHMKKIVVKDSAVAALTHGADLGATGISKLQDGIEADDHVAILTLKGELVATATAKTGTDMMLEQDVEAANLDRVYMRNDVYPKQW